MAPKRSDIASRFWAKVNRLGPDDCWPWTAAKNKPGYGQFWDFHTKTMRNAHRTAFFLHHGHWPTDLCCHTCDNPACCNPAHLFDGSHDDNMADRQIKGRQARGIHQGAHTKPEKRVRGEAHGGAKLTTENVLAIRADVQISKPGLARKFGVSLTTVKRIRARKIWTHV